MDLELAGKTAIVTGGSRGIGKAIAHELAAEGVDVAIIARMRNVAVVAMSKNLAVELGPHGINVTVVHPGLTYTEKTPGVIAAAAQRQGISQADVEKRMVNNLLGRWVDAREIAYVVTFLASPKAAAVNGDVIPAAGGVGGSIYY